MYAPAEAQVADEIGGGIYGVIFSISRYPAVAKGKGTNHQPISVEWPSKHQSRFNAPLINKGIC